MKKIILYGDSIMAGFSNGHPTDIITAALQEKFPQTQIINRSVPGATTSEALDFLSLKVTDEDYDLVVLEFGTNDANARLGLRAGAYAYNLQTIIDQIGKKKVILVGPNYANWDVDPNMAWPRIIQFELVAQQCALANQVPFLDLAKLVRNQEHPRDYLQEDGIHLNRRGNEIFLKQLINLIATKI